MITVTFLITAYLCLPTFNPIRGRLPELVVEPDARMRGSVCRQVTSWVAQVAVRARERVRIVIGGERTSPAVLLGTVAALDIIGACLSSGMSLSQAMEATADGANPELAEPFRQYSARLAAGAHSVWDSLAATPVLEPLATAGRRANESGIALVQALEDTATTHRSQAYGATQAVAEKTGVLTVGPLALCSLPTFVVLGLVLTIAGLANKIFTGLMPSWSSDSSAPSFARWHIPDTVLVVFSVAFSLVHAGHLPRCNPPCVNAGQYASMCITPHN